MSDSPDFDAQVPFVRWLHAQVKGDQDRSMPYAAIYRWGPRIQELVGVNGKFDSKWVAIELSQQGATADDLAALAMAEAAWRVDTIIDSAEEAGVSLDVGEVEVIPEEMSRELEVAEAKVLCGYRNHRGEGCTSEAVEGAGRCGRHGGAITDPEVRRSFLLVAFAKVIDGSRVAVEALLDVAENGRSEMARVQAAKELLDRAGVQQDQHVHIHRPSEDASEDDIVDEIRRRLITTTDRLRIMAIPVTPEDSDETSLDPITSKELVHVPVRSADDEIIDAVIVKDDDV